MLGKCRLCSEIKELRESHVFPKFIFKWIKSTGGRFLRSPENPNIRFQDGLKQYFLCETCEAKFSSAEKYFSENIFNPYLEDGRCDDKYSARLFYFLISISWRILWQYLESCKQNKFQFANLLIEAEEKWRMFLLHGNRPDPYNEVHLIFTDIVSGEEQPVENLNVYLTRAIDGTIVSNSTICALYSKFSRFISFASITPFDQSMWINTRVNIDGGFLKMPQTMNDGVLGEFILDRARFIGQSKGHLSDKQNKAIGEEIFKYPSKYIESDYGRAMLADQQAKINPFTVWPDNIGHNELCPCGSGQKFKKCHGRR